MSTVEATPKTGRANPPKARGLPPGLTFALRKIAHLVFVLLAATFLVSAMLDLLPGDPARAILGEEATPDQIQTLRASLRLDEPLHIRYLAWLGDALHGDLGTSYRTGQPVAEVIMDRLPVSIELMVIVQVIALVAAISLAVYSTYRPNGWVDRVSSTWAFAAISAPQFVVGLILVYVFAIALGWLPASGYRPIEDGLGQNLMFLLLPAFAMALEPAGVYQRLLRADMQTTMNEEFVLAAQAMMGQVSRLGKVLGPRGLMPTPKAGTVVPASGDLAQVVREFKAGKVEYRTDKTGQIHAGVGKMSFDDQKLAENITTFVEQIRSVKPSGVKGNFINGVVLSATMSPGIRLAI